MRTTIPQAVRWACRIAFAALIAFETANYVRIFDFKLDYTWFGLLITSVSVWVAIEVSAYLLAKKQVVLHWSVWPLSLSVIALDAFGDMLHFYSRWRGYDMAIHFIGTAVVVIVLLTVISMGRRMRAAGGKELLLALGLAVTIGTIYEIEEYLEDVIGAHYHPRLGDGPDTANDLLLNLLGAVAATMVIWLMQKWSRKKESILTGGA